jgi:hypothetical protein
VSRLTARQGRSWFIAIVVGTAMAIPAASQGAMKTDYSGTFATTGELSFALKKRRGERRVKEWSWSNFPVTCGADPRTTSGRYLFSLEVRHRRFSGRAVRRSQSGEVVGGAKVVGEFSRAYSVAEGTFRVYGETPEGSKDCESGKVGWTAQPKVAPPRPR